MARRLDSLPKDSLSGLLRALEVRSTVYCVSELSAPWGFHVEDSSAAKYHIVLEGACMLSLDTGEQLALESGDMVLIPQGTGHTVRDRLDSSVRDLGRILAEFRTDDEPLLVYGGRGEATRLLCGGFVLNNSLPIGLLAMLPRALRLDAGASGMHRWLEPVFSLLHEELGGARPGASAILAKLADVFLAEVLRTYLVGAEQTGVIRLSAFANPAIARAVAMMHASPAEAWTVSRLAGEVGMSRTLFSSRFRECLGESPMHYLAHVRLSRAAGQLTTTTATLFAIAQQQGYDSEASFSKAFKRAFGRSPGEYRRESLTQPIRIAESI